MRTATSPPQVTINRVPLDRTSLQRLSGAVYPNAIMPGDYWYDATCGAWGMMGGPCLGVMVPGLAIGGSLPADASGGGGTEYYLLTNSNAL
jgi:hypothetical protein